MLARVYSCAVIGLDGVVVEVEVDYTSGMTIVLPDAAVQESRERVQTAVRNAGVPYPRKRLVVNLAPASVRKEGPAYDLLQPIKKAPSVSGRRSLSSPCSLLTYSDRHSSTSQFIGFLRFNIGDFTENIQ